MAVESITASVLHGERDLRLVRLEEESLLGYVKF